jgi:pimeloyl-ACP methyl ester carboxylesterase
MVNAAFSPDLASALEEVRRLRDALGQTVDPEIELLVVALRICGFTTISSCGGHLDRATDGPYVMMHSMAGAQAMATALQACDSEKLETLKRAQELTLRDADTLYESVAAFEQSRPARISEPRMEVRPVGHSDFRLCFVHADFDRIRSADDRCAELVRRREWVDRFADWLLAQSQQAIAA